MVLKGGNIMSSELAIETNAQYNKYRLILYCNYVM